MKVSKYEKIEAKKFGEFLRALRKACPIKMTLRRVKEMTGISVCYMSQLENGSRPVPTLRILVKLGEIYGVPFGAILCALNIQVDYKAEKMESRDERSLFRCYRSMDLWGKYMVAAYAEFLMGYSSRTSYWSYTKKQRRESMRYI